MFGKGKHSFLPQTKFIKHC